MILVAIDPGIKGSIVIEKDGIVTVQDPPTYAVTTKVYSGIRKGKTITRNYYDLPRLASLIPEGLSVCSIAYRLKKGYPIEDALTIPAKNKGNRYAAS